MRYYIVTGRVCGDDEDTMVVFEDNGENPAERFVVHMTEASALLSAGTAGQDREAYSDDQDRGSYAADPDERAEVYVISIASVEATEPPQILQNG